MPKYAQNPRENILQAALQWRSQGFSVIPVHGDSAPQQPKKPTLPWRRFQQNRPSKDELRTLFDSRAQALGIVCGQVSQLVVVDFDDHMRYRRFCRVLPQFADTFTVKTRRGYHLYFRTVEKVPSHQFPGGDIKGERGYVVAPPSIITGHAYHIIDERPMLPLDKPALDAMLNHFHIPSVQPILPAPTIARRDLDLVALYQRFVPNMGRNNALYRVASIARQIGKSLAAIKLPLLQAHCQAQALGNHAAESPAQRHMEGLRTMESAYASSNEVPGWQKGIANAVRERLLQEQRSTVMARLLDIMQLAGWQAESTFTLREAVELSAARGLNRKSVLRALTGEQSTFNGRHIITRRYVEYLDIRGLKEKRRGRPLELLFIVPSPLHLQSVLDVGWTPSDALKESDLQTAASYRRALHREYVRRLQPQLAQSILAGRLGVACRTLRRYNRQLGLQRTVCVGRFALSADALACLPRAADRKSTPGYWIEDADARRYPAWQHVARALRRQGRAGLQLCVQRPSQLSPAAAGLPARRYERYSLQAFLELRLARGEHVAEAPARPLARRFLQSAGRALKRVSYHRLRLFYDTVTRRIADDKVAETISAYLVAVDGQGAEVRRPARRGVAYRMLKQFGNGNVFLALRDTSDAEDARPRSLRLVTAPR